MTNLLQSLTEWAGALTGYEATIYTGIGGAFYAIGVGVHAQAGRHAAACFLWPIFDLAALCWVATWPARRAIGWVRGRREQKRQLAFYVSRLDKVRWRNGRIERLGLAADGAFWIPVPLDAPEYPIALQRAGPAPAQPQPSAGVRDTHSAKTIARAFGQSADNPEKPTVLKRLDEHEERLRKLEGDSTQGRSP